MKKISMGIIFTLVVLPALGALAQTAEPPFPVTLEKQLAARAKNYTEVTLDRKMLAFASHFMDKEDDEDGKRIVAKLNGVYVRTYEFDKPGQYTAADLDAIRRQFQTPEWTSLVKSRSKNGEDDSDIYIKMAGTEAQGMFILNAEPNELDFVYLDGPINPDDLSDLGGNFGIPKGAGKSLKEASK
jgi:hypothetical protein